MKGVSAMTPSANASLLSCFFDFGESPPTGGGSGGGGVGGSGGGRGWRIGRRQMAWATAGAVLVLRAPWTPPRVLVIVYWK